MTQVASDVIAYGLAATASVSLLLSIVLILTGRDAAATGLWFLVGLVLGLSGVSLIIALLGDLLAEEGTRERLVLDLMKLALGLFLLAVAWHERPAAAKRKGGTGSGIKGFLEKLEGLTPRTALSTGLVMAMLPKRLVVTVLAASTIALAGLERREGAVLATVYVLLASSSAWVVLVAFVVSGKRGESLMAVMEDWLITHAHPLAFALSLAFGLLFTGQAAAALLL